MIEEALPVEEEVKPKKKKVAELSVPEPATSEQPKKKKKKAEEP